MSPDLVRAFAPTGVLRAAINLGNPLLVALNPDNGKPFGLSIDLAHQWAQQLGVPVEHKIVDKAAQAVALVADGEADIGFFAVDPKRAADIAFTAPYLLIEGSYLVPAGSGIGSNAEVDRDGVRVVVGKGSAYDLFLSRELKHAQIVHADSSQAVVDTCIEQGLEVAAGVRQQLVADMARHPGCRLLDGRFMQIRQAMALPKARGDAAAAALAAFIEREKASGAIAEALKRHAIDGGTVAPPGVDGGNGNAVPDGAASR